MRRLKASSDRCPNVSTDSGSFNIHFLGIFQNHPLGHFLSDSCQDHINFKKNDKILAHYFLELSQLRSPSPRISLKWMAKDNNFCILDSGEINLRILDLERDIEILGKDYACLWTKKINQVLGRWISGSDQPNHSFSILLSTREMT